MTTIRRAFVFAVLVAALLAIGSSAAIPFGNGETNLAVVNPFKWVDPHHAPVNGTIEADGSVCLVQCVDLYRVSTCANGLCPSCYLPRGYACPNFYCVC